MATVATGQVPPAGFTPTRTTTSIAASVRRVFPSTASRPVFQAGPARLHEVFPSGWFAIALRAPRLSRLLPVLCRGTRCAGAPPFERLPPLYPRGPRSGPGYSVPHHHHLIGPMRPTRRHISISPTRLIRDALAVRHTSTPRRPASGSVLSLAILCRHVALRDPGKPIGCLYPVPSPTALAFDLLGRSRHFLHPPPSDSRGGVHFGA